MEPVPLTSMRLIAELAAEERACDIEGDEVIELFRRDALGRHVHRLARSANVVDQGIDSPVFTHRGVNEPFAFVGLGHVGGDERHRLAFTAQRGSNLIAPFGTTPCSDDERTLASERLSRRPSDTGRHTGDRYDLVLDRHIDLPSTK